MHSDIFANLLPRNNLLIQHRRRSTLELVIPLLRHALVRRDQVPHQRRLLRGNYADIHVRSGAQVVEDAGLDRVAGEFDRFVLRHLVLPLRLEDRHRCQGAAAHGHVGQFIGTAVGVHGE